MDRVGGTLLSVQVLTLVFVDRRPTAGCPILVAVFATRGGFHQIQSLGFLFLQASNGRRSARQRPCWRRGTAGSSTSLGMTRIWIEVPGSKLEAQGSELAASCSPRYTCPICLGFRKAIRRRRRRRFTSRPSAAR